MIREGRRGKEAVHSQLQFFHLSSPSLLRLLPVPLVNYIGAGWLAGAGCACWLLGWLVCWLLLTFFFPPTPQNIFGDLETKKKKPKSDRKGG